MTSSSLTDIRSQVADPGFPLGRETICIYYWSRQSVQITSIPYIHVFDDTFWFAILVFTILGAAYMSLLLSKRQQRLTTSCFAESLAMILKAMASMGFSIDR